jgi:hypothetical protein
LCPPCRPSRHKRVHVGGAKVAVAACLVAVLYNGVFKIECIPMALVYDMLTHPVMVQPDTTNASLPLSHCIKPNPHNVIFVRQASKHPPENRSRRIGRLSRQFIPNTRRKPAPSSCDKDESCCPMPWFVTWRHRARSAETSNENPLYMC